MRFDGIAAVVEPKGGATADGDDRIDEHVPTPRPSLLRNLAHLMTSQVVTWVLATLIAVRVPRYLGPTEQGQLRLAGAVWAITQLFVGLGTGTYLTLEVARNRSRGLALVGPTVVLRLLAFALSTAVLAAVGVFAGVDLPTATIFALMGLGVLVTMVSDTASSALTGLEHMSFPAKAAVISKFIYAGVVLAVIALGGDVRAIAAAGLPGAIVGLVIVWAAFRRFGIVTFRRPFGEMRGIVRSSRVFLALGAVLVIYQQIDTVVIASLVEAEVLGWYSTADTLFGTLLFVPTILMTVLFPRFSRLHVEDPTRMRELVAQAFSLLMLVVVPLGLGTVVVADNVALLLFGPEFRETGPVLAVFGVVLILTFGTILLGGVAAASDLQRTWNLVMVAAIVASIPLDIVLVPWADQRYGNGAIGGALAYIVTEAGMLVFGISTFARTIVDRATVRRLVKVFAAGAVMVAATWPLRNELVAVPIVVGAMVYVAATWSLRTLTGEEEQMVRQAIARVRPRRAAESTPNG